MSDGYLTGQGGGGAKINGVEGLYEVAPNVTIAKGDFTYRDINIPNTAYKALPCVARWASSYGRENGYGAPEAVTLFNDTIVAILYASSVSPYQLMLYVCRVGAEENGVATVVSSFGGSGNQTLKRLSDDSVIIFDIQSSKIMGIRYSVSPGDLSVTSLDSQWMTPFSDLTVYGSATIKGCTVLSIERIIIPIEPSPTLIWIGLLRISDGVWDTTKRVSFATSCDYGAHLTTVRMIDSCIGMVFFASGMSLRSIAFKISDDDSLSIGTATSINGYYTNYGVTKDGDSLRVVSYYDTSYRYHYKLTTDVSLVITVVKNYTAPSIRSFRYARYWAFAGVQMIAGMDGSGYLGIALLRDVGTYSVKAIENPNMYVSPAIIDVHGCYLYIIAIMASGKGDATSNGQLSVWKVTACASNNSEYGSLNGVAKTGGTAGEIIKVIEPQAS